MLKIDSVFFGEKGLSSASAAHIRDLAYAMTRNMYHDLNTVGLVNEDVSFNDNQTRNRVKVGWDAGELSQFGPKLDLVIRIIILERWLEEAQEEKDKLIYKVRSGMKDEDVCKELGIEMPEAPEREPDLEEDEYIDSLPVKERSVIVALKTKVSYYRRLVGQPKSAFARACQEMHDVKKKPTEVDRSLASSACTVMMHHYEPSMDEKQADAVFFDLMQKYREAQAELNKHMFRVKDAVAKENLRRANDYMDACRRFNHETEEMHTKVDIWRKEQYSLVEDLKIVIPDDMKEVYETVRTSGRE